MKFRNLLVLTFAIFALASCVPDDHDHEIVAIDYQLDCSEDLLEFVTPIITYTDSIGTHELYIDDSMWCYNEDTNSKFFNLNLEFDDFITENTVYVRYELKQNVVIDPDKEYIFSHSLKFLKVKTTRESHGPEFIFDFPRTPYVGEAAKAYIDELLRTSYYVGVQTLDDGGIMWYNETINIDIEWYTRWRN